MPRRIKKSMSDVGKRIVKLRGELSQKEFAHWIGVPASSVSRWEDGAIYPAVTSVILIAAACGVSTDWILTGVEFED